MIKESSSLSDSTDSFLGIEGGATRSTAVLMNSHGSILKRVEGDPCNLRLQTDHEIIGLWLTLKRQLERAPRAIGVFLAGCRTKRDEMRMLQMLRLVWPNSKYNVGNDTLSAQEAALGSADGIVVICGTGSIIRARKENSSIQVGGYGHVGGDAGSGYWLGRELLHAVFSRYDRLGSTDGLTRSILNFLGLNTIDELVQWSLEASKHEIASLTKPLFRNLKHPSARQLIQQASEILAEDVKLASEKVGYTAKDRIQIGLNPGLAKHQSAFRKQIGNSIKKRLPKANVFLSEVEGAVGAARLAAKAVGILDSRFEISDSIPEVSHSTFSDSCLKSRGLAQSITEQRNPRTMDLDRRSISQLVKTMLDEESRNIPAIRKKSKQIEQAIQWIVNSFKCGGRLFYLGAGTSGRIGVLDASECPPTFGSDPEMVQGIMAGGWKALYRSMEGVEDDTEYGRQVIRDRGIGKKDVLVGIAASGSTPFVLAGLKEAHLRGAKTVLLTFNPHTQFSIPHSQFLKIDISTGPEVITGSTRLKAGTATKLVLNMFTTISMIRLGKVKSNLMVDLDPTCEKLHDRATRIYSALKKISYEQAWKRLEESKWNLKILLRTKG